MTKTCLTGFLFAFRVGNNFWWIPVVGPMIGAFLGGLIYILFIQMHHSKLDPDMKAEPSENNLEKHELSVIM